MANVLFISESFLKENTVINTNIEFKQMRPTIIAAQDMQIQQAIGSPMYKELKTEIATSSLTAANQTLLNDHIQPALMYWVLADAPLVISYKFANKGIVTHDSDNASPASLNEINFLSQRYKKKAEWYTEQITSFLCANHLDYPTYDGDVPEGGIRPNQNQYTSGLFVGSKMPTKRLDGSGSMDVYFDPY